MLPSAFDNMDACYCVLPGSNLLSKSVHAQIPSLHPVTPTCSRLEKLPAFNSNRPKLLSVSLCSSSVSVSDRRSFLPLSVTRQWHSIPRADGEQYSPREGPTKVNLPRGRLSSIASTRIYGPAYHDLVTSSPEAGEICQLKALGDQL